MPSPADKEWRQGGLAELRYSQENVELWQGDSRDMSFLPDESVSLFGIVEGLVAFPAHYQEVI